MPNPDSPEAPRQRRWGRLAPTVKKKYGASRQTLWRWVNDPTLNFPETKYFGGSVYVDLDELDAWDDRRPVVTPGPDTPADYLKPPAKAGAAAVARSAPRKQGNTSGEDA